jgi:hypothetical protein
MSVVAAGFLTKLLFVDDFSKALKIYNLMNTIQRFSSYFMRTEGRTERT